MDRVNHEYYQRNADSEKRRMFVFLRHNDTYGPGYPNPNNFGIAGQKRQANNSSGSGQWRSFCSQE